MKVRSIFEVGKDTPSTKLRYIADYYPVEGAVVTYRQVIIDGSPFVQGDLRGMITDSIMSPVGGCEYLDAMGLPKLNLLDIYIMED